jgi:hypothetical protein
MPAGFGQGVNVFQAAGQSLTLGSPGTKMRDHLGQRGQVDARWHVTVRTEFRPSLYGASLSGSKVSGKSNVRVIFEWWLLPAFRHVEVEQAPPTPSTTRRLPGSQKANGQGFEMALGGFGWLEALGSGTS